MESLGDLTTRRQGEDIVRSSPDFQKEADRVTQSLKSNGGINNG